jgi:hypothetical protein
MTTARRARRLAPRLAACAFFGVLLTCGVALAASVVGPLRRDRSSLIDLPEWHGQVPSTFPRSPDRRYSASGFGKRRHFEFGPAGMYQARWAEAGWPFPAFRGGIGTWRSDDGTFGTSFRRAIEIPERIAEPEEFFGNAMVPIEPIATGFALDTAFYAALILSLWSTPGLIRRRSRRARGRCPACGYDLTGGTTPNCPECGTAT